MARKATLKVDLGPWKRLAREMRATGKFNPRALNAEQLLRDCISGMAVVLWDKDGSRIIAYGTLEMSGTSCQIRKLFVAKDYRGDGNGKAVIENIVRRLMLIPVDAACYFAITDNESVMEVLLKLDFKVTTKFNMPNVRQWAKCIGLGKRLPRSATIRDPHHSKRRKRWLFTR